MNIIAKMQCESVKPCNYGPNGEKSSENISLRAVYSDSPENKSFSEATPTACVTMTISNPSAWGAFEVGKEYLVQFQEAK